MYGAILGDMIGSPYERDRAYTNKFPLFRKRSHFTDDTVMTIAVADALLKVSSLCGDEGLELLKRAGMDILDMDSTYLVESI